jgi:CRP-like cAMP-binding protein/Zn-dependent protease
MATARAAIWRRVDAAVEEAPEPGDDATDAWARLVELTDLGEFRPKLAPDVEIKDFHLRWGNDYSMIANPRDLIHYRLEPWEAEVVRLMDGSRTVNEIVLTRLEQAGDLDVSAVADLAWTLRQGNFLDRPFLDVYAATRRALRPVSVAREKARTFGRTLSIEWKGADRLVRWSYRNGLRFFFAWPAQLFAAAATIGGLLAFWNLARSGQFSLSGESLALGFLALLALNYSLTFLHELGHAVVLTHYGRRVKSAGFFIYFGSPAFFVDSSDGLMMERRQRIVQSFAGPYAELIVAGIAIVLAWGFPDTAIAPTLYTFAVLNYLVLFMNLVPLLELDGYWILSDAIQVPDLRPMSLSFIRHDLWHKLARRERFTPQQVGLALYGIIGVLFTVFSFYTAYFFWEEVFGAFVRRMWNAGPVPRLLLVALGLFVLGPVIRGGIRLVRSLVRRAAAIWRKVRFRLETSWRVEAARLIDGLPLFEDLPIEVLNDLAGRVRLRTAARGQPVFRQGDRADAFYVVRRGTLQVLEEDPATGAERLLRTLSRGDAFGELGILESAPRAATVRAAEEAEVFEVDKGTFDRLLADAATPPDLAPTLQAAAQLRDLPPFRHLGSEGILELLEHGEWINVAPGEAVVEEGEVGDAFYALGAGQVEVFEGKELVRTLGPGSYFGEIALLRDEPRTATVRARTPVRAYRLDREGFERLVAGAFRKGSLVSSARVDLVDRTAEH